ncbi:hypothetical protein TTHERM_00939210 (macronuclear) [Tetrahymena thermophila SB210]|uniref:Uncharacterized protein n=1 Tax=Tetrahymena thermophila (strain SB210) TaxID=312017 RepID=Q22DM2_TETTS|nr:hypothetical protein TTHERM_00939210 [Tetrahymena thermophila SB210]EAR83432.1 hypothetical protein TTHERM_00939210 [Tetrahymena thermophila SB210]|eukprot:XP_001031095.1 hypothetical protein TTHERM_00939210 [Tetrahymena thermophila SB210]
MSLSTTQKINQVINPQFLGFSIAQGSEVTYDEDLAKEVDKLYELSMKLKDKIAKAVPASSQVKEENKQNEEQKLIENLNEIGKKFSFQSIDNLKKNIHLFDPKLERVKHNLQNEAHQKSLDIFKMNLMQSLYNQGSEDPQQTGDQKGNNNNNKLNNTVTQCLQILESRWQTELKLLQQKN